MSTSPDLDKAHAERAQLVGEIHDIQTQLGERNRLGPDGQRLVGPAYWSWRSRATASLNHKQKQLIDLNTRIKFLNADERAMRQGDFDMLLHAYYLLKELAQEVDLEPNEAKVVSNIEEYLKNRSDPV